MFLITIAAAVAQAASAPAATAPVSRGPLERYVTSDDYPQGVAPSAARPVGVSLIIGPDGRVASCTITTSSGSGLLDATTCRLLRSRTRFTPSTSAGVPVAGEVKTTIDWPAIRDGGSRPVAGSPPVIQSSSPPIITLPVPAPPSQLGPGGTRARASFATLITAADYPAEALRAGEQGTTGFKLAIGTDGSVTDCSITQTSGSASLDAATCRLIISRARFSPALDARGKPTTDTFSSRIVWRLPPQSLLVPDIAVARFAIGADNKASDCRTSSQSLQNSQETKAPDCGGRPLPSEVIAALRAAGGEGALRVRIETRLLRDAAAPWPKLERAGLKIVGFDLLRLRVAPGGEVLGCVVLDRQSGGLPVNNFCRPNMRIPGYTATGEAEMRIVAFTALETA